MVLRERRSTGGGATGSRTRRLAARRGVVGALVGALLMLVAATALAATGADLGVLGLAASDDAGPATATGPPAGDGAAAAPALTTAPGACLTWSREDASDVTAVDCARAHLFEGAGPLTAPSPPGAPFPADAEWQQLVTDRCAPLARAYLGGRLDPAGRYRAGALKPTRAAWDGGDRTVRCGLQAPGRSGALYPSTGRVADADQAAVFPTGTCLGLAGKEVSDPVACADTHAAEVVGTVDLGGPFPGGAPSVADQDNYLQPACTGVAQDLLGGAAQLTDSKLTVYWTNLAPESWDAGTRRVDCNLGALLPDGSGFAPLVGSARTGVRIAVDGAAAPVPSLRPGAPAPLPAELEAALDAADPPPDTAPAPAGPVPGTTGTRTPADPVVPSVSAVPPVSTPAAPVAPPALPGG